MKLWRLIKRFFQGKEVIPSAMPVTPKPLKNGLKIGLVVGHELKARGAWNHNKTLQEYDYFKYALSQVVSETENTAMFLRDGTTIRGAIDKAAAWGADIIIEFHWNAFNGKAEGAEALSYSAHNPLAKQFLEQWCREMGLVNRGVKARTPKQAGFTSVQRIHTQAKEGFLWEAFFGDNPKDYIDSERTINFLVQWIKQKQGA